jgi:hypothetical protein
MEAKFKDFGAGDANAGADISFALYGQNFKCFPQMQGKAIIDFTITANTDNAGAQAAVMNDFFKATIVPEDYARFDALCRAPETIVTVEVLASIVSWIMEQYTNRPKEDLINS